MRKKPVFRSLSVGDTRGRGTGGTVITAESSPSVSAER